MTNARKFNKASKAATPAELLQSICAHIDAASAETTAMTRRRSHIRQALMLNNQLITALDEHVSEEASQFWRTMTLDIKQHDTEVDKYVRSLIRPNQTLIDHSVVDLSKQLKDAKDLAAEVRDGNPRYQRPGEKEEYAWMTAGRISNALAIAENRTRQIMYLQTGKMPAPSPRK